MKINLPIFKDEDTKDAVTYQSWRWDLMVYHRAGCRDCTLLPYAIQSLQVYPVKNSMAYHQMLQKKALVARAVAATAVPETSPETRV